MKEKNKTTEVTRQDIDAASRKSTSTYSKLVHQVNKILGYINVPLPDIRINDRSFGETVIQNIAATGAGKIENSTALAQETAFLAVNGSLRLGRGLFQAGNAATAHKTGRIFREDVNDGAENTRLGVVSAIGMFGTFAASCVAAGTQHPNHKTGKALRLPETKSESQQQETNANTSISNKM